MCSCGTDMSVLAHSAETLLPYPWLPIPGPAPLPAPGDHPSFWVCPSKEAGRLLQDTNSKGCGAANTSLCCLLQALTNGIPTGWMDSAGPSPPLEEDVSSRESQPTPKHAGWRQSQGNWGGWDMQTSVPHLTAVETEQKNYNDANSDWKAGQEMSGRNP